MQFKEEHRVGDRELLAQVNGIGDVKRQRLLSDTPAIASTRKQTSDFTREFRSKLKTLKNQTGEGHNLYAFTMSLTAKPIHQQGKWWDDDYRERLLGKQFQFLLGRLSSYCEPNYRRNTHKLFRIQSIGTVEHYSKEPELVPAKNFDGRVIFQKGTQRPQMNLIYPLVSPHTHSVIAVHHKWDERFLECFTRTLCRHYYEINRELIKGTAFEEWDRTVASVRLEPIYDLTGWIKYEVKQSQGSWSNGDEKQETKFQGCGFLGFDGVASDALVV